MPLISFPVSDVYSVTVAQGDTVKQGQVLAHKVAPAEHILNIPEAMDISLKEVKHVLKKSIGDIIQKGDIIAEKKSLFGKRKAVITSSIDGTITRYERSTGNLIVQTDQKTASNEIISPVAGTVDLCNNKEIVIATDNAIVGLQASSGTSASGELAILTESFQSGGNNILYFLDSRAVGKVILGGTISRDILIKGNGIGVAGFIGVTIRESDLDYLRERRITMPVITISHESSETLKKAEGEKVTLDASNKIIIF